MEVPVFVTNRHKRPVSGRFDPYYDWISNCSYKEFLEGKFDYDFANPPKNSDEYLKVRNAMIKSIDEFVARYKDEDGNPEDYKKTDYTAEELYKWRCETMRDCMNRWFDVTVEEEKKLKENKAVKKADDEKIAKQEKLIGEQKALISEQKKLIGGQKEQIKKLSGELKACRKSNERYEKIIGCKTVKNAVKVRNAFMPDGKKIKLK
jgi:uncharacterized coiled-coil protein SlyX